MPDPQGFIDYPNIAKPIGGSYTLSHGINPGSIVISFAPQQQKIPEYGDVTIRYASTQMTFPDCKLVAPLSQLNDAGQIISVTILDRRWQWRFGHISGKYNIRKQDGDVDTATEKTPQELAELLFQAMGEPTGDATALPNDSRPEVDWDFDNPAQELAELCENLGCRIVLNTNNKVHIRRRGVGQPLPDNGKQISVDYGIDAGVRPSQLMLVGGPVKYQTRFSLEAVGLTADGQYLPLDELPYKPAGGWEVDFPPLFGAVLEQHGKEAHQLAQRSVYRAYRIKGTAPGGGFVFRHGPITNASFEDVVPIEDVLVETSTGPNNVPVPKPAKVVGEFWKDESLQLDENTGGETDPNQYNKSFSVRGEEGLVEFSDPVIRIDNDKIYPARLFVECAHSLRFSDDRRIYRYTRDRRLPGLQFTTAPMIINVDEATLTIVQKYNAQNQPTNVVTNEQQIGSEADQILAERVAEFQQPESVELEYAGLIDISPDGAIQQVGWKFGESGAFTNASINSEWDVETPGYEERRRRDRETRGKMNARRMIAAGKRQSREIVRRGR
jgi:hypothetical protein